VLIKYRASDDHLRLVENILRPFRSRYVYMTYEDHDLVTANTQAVTHAAFLRWVPNTSPLQRSHHLFSMGTAWSQNKCYPWEHGYYVGGIETVKVNIMLRIYSNQWHVYAGLAILNPSARMQIDQYASSATDLFKLMISGDEDTFRERVYDAREKVFGADGDAERQRRTPILLSEDFLDQFSLGRGKRSATTADAVPADQSSATSTHAAATAPQPESPPPRPLPNSHLSLLSMVDCWARLGIQPLDHLDLAATPIFRMWFGVAEYLFRSRARLDAAIHAAMHDLSLRPDDVEFIIAARGWSQCVSFGSFELYRRRFMDTRAFFESRFDEATLLGSQMIHAIMESGTP
jgi:prephenate dehydrogenase (NADP+)